MAIANVKEYILLEQDRIKREKWCLGVNFQRLVSYEEAICHFKSDIYDGLTPEDWFHIDAVRDVTRQVSEGKRSLDDPLVMGLLNRVNSAIDKLWQGLESEE